LTQLKAGQIITFEQSGVKIKVKTPKEDSATCEVVTG
jgi:phage gp45-like